MTKSKGKVRIQMKIDLLPCLPWLVSGRGTGGRGDCKCNLVLLLALTLLADQYQPKFSPAVQCAHFTCAALRRYGSALSLTPPP